VSVVLPHQIINVPLAEINSVFSIQSDKPFIFGPVVLRVGIPIHSELCDQKQRKRLLFLNFVVDVQKCFDESVVGH
jgi:hypothetical protein